MIKCPKCGSGKTYKRPDTKVSWRCAGCNHTFKPNQPDEPQKKVKMNKSTSGISVAELRAKHDLNFILEKGIEQLKGSERLFTTAEFAQKIKMPPSAGTRRMEEHLEYQDYHGKCSSGVFWGDPKIIEDLKNDNVLR